MDQATGTGAAEGDEIRLRCACGWQTAGSVDAVVVATQEHGRRLHNMKPSRDEVLVMAAATARDEATGGEAAGGDTPIRASGP